MKVLVVVGETNRGGTETWLLQIARELQGRCEFDFLVHTPDEGAYDKNLVDLGVRIVRCTRPRNPIAYAKEFLSILRNSGPYDVVHSHVQCYSGWILFLAWLGGVRKRIAHGHSDLRAAHVNCGLVRKCYVRAMLALIRIFATKGLATSSPAAESLFGARWRSDCRCSIHLSCVDLHPFGQAENAGDVRSSLGIPKDAVVVGHVGSFRPEKNHGFALQVAAGLRALSPRYWFLFKGDGALKAAVERQAHDLQISDRCVFLPSDNDVPRVLRGAIDVFLFPSILEGLGLALVEAQAAGLRCFVSEKIPTEAIAVPEIVERLRLSDGPELWGRRIHEAVGQEISIDQAAALQRVYESGFDICRNAAALLCSYSAAA